MLDYKTLNKILTPIIEELINALYEPEEEERILITDEAFDELDDLLDEYDTEEDLKAILEFANSYIDKEETEHDIDISPLKQMIAERINW